MYDQKYVSDMLCLFDGRNDPRLLPLIKQVQNAYQAEQINEAATVWIPKLLDSDAKITLDDMLELTSHTIELEAINDLLHRGIYRAAAYDISDILQRGVWKPSIEQRALLQRFWDYYAE